MFEGKETEMSLLTPGRRQSKTPILLRNVDQKSIETVFSIVICCPTGDKWQSKTLFLSILICVRRLLIRVSIADLLLLVKTFKSLLCQLKWSGYALMCFEI